MSVDPRTLGWLNRALTHEMRAAQQYFAQSVLLRLWGEQTLALHLRREALEELQHAERLMERLIILGVAPSSGHIPPARLGRTIEELLVANRELEMQAVRLYDDALNHARRISDFESGALFAEILEEELSHLRELESTQRQRHTQEPSLHG